MFVAQDFLYVDIQKTASTHIEALLAAHTKGVVFRGRGRHARPRPEELAGRTVLCSIRNPWDWYVSLWGFGCRGKGEVRVRAVRPEHRFPPAFESRGQLLKRVGHELLRSPPVWRFVYGDVNDVRRFRAWLRMVLAPRNRFVAGESYGSSELWRLCGLYTYRYLQLCVLGIDTISSTRRLKKESLRHFESKHRIVEHIIRVENLEADLIRALDSVGVPLSEPQQQQIRNAGRTNASERDRDWRQYYDRASARLVREREWLLVERYKYRGPFE